MFVSPLSFAFLLLLLPFLCTISSVLASPVLDSPSPATSLPQLILDLSSCTSSPRHVHLQFTGHSHSRSISYATFPVSSNSSSSSTDPCSSSQDVSSHIHTSVRYGTDPFSLNQIAKGSNSLWTGTSSGYLSFLHSVVLHDLDHNTIYYYQAGHESYGWSDIFSFSTSVPDVVAVYGDLGLKNDVSLQQIQYETNHNAFQAVLHVGDLAYNLNSKNGTTGDRFLDAIEDVMASVPYMVLPGNHEKKHNFSEYINRFLGHNEIGHHSQSDTNLYYSFNLGLAHYIAFHTEAFLYSVDAEELKRMMTWLEDDLAEAVQNREKRPWIILLGHRPFWLLPDDISLQLQTIALHYHIDLYLTGHQHNYNRMFPYFNSTIDPSSSSSFSTYDNPVYPVTIVSGSPGCKSEIGNTSGPAEFLAVSVLEYGFGKLVIVNETHLYWSWELVAEASAGERIEEPQVLDELWIVQEGYGHTQESRDRDGGKGPAERKEMTDEEKRERERETKERIEKKREEVNEVAERRRLARDADPERKEREEKERKEEEEQQAKEDQEYEQEEQSANEAAKELSLYLSEFHLRLY